MRKKVILLSLASTLFFVKAIYAEVPVEDAYGPDQSPPAVQAAPVSQNNTTDPASQTFQPVSSSTSADNTPSPSTAGMTLEQRLSRLEQQTTSMQNMAQQNNALQQQLQDLQGRLDVQAHDLKMMQAQQRDIYQEVEQLNGKTTVAVQPASNSASPVNQEESAFKEQDAYDKAYGYIHNHQYKQAIDAMKAYLKSYPQGKYAANSNYWLGELYMLNSDEQNAKVYFESVIRDFPQQPKVADAMLKLGMIAQDSNDIKEARKQYKAVARQFPGSATARLAQQNLSKLSDQSSD